MTIHPGMTLRPTFSVGDRVVIDESCRDYPGHGGAMHGIIKGRNSGDNRYAVEFDTLTIGHDCIPVEYNPMRRAYIEGKPLCTRPRGWWVREEDIIRYSEIEDKCSAYVARELKS